MNTSLVGVLMLDTRFPRPLGDIGHPGSWTRLGLQALYQVVDGALPQRIVTPGSSAEFLPPFIEAALNLVHHGAQAITTSCGFLARHQSAMQAALPVPVFSSGLLWCRQLQQAGILTIAAERLGEQDLNGAGVPPATPVAGVSPKGEFRRRILGNQTQMDLALAEADVVAAARRLLQRYPQVRHIVLECTNMPPYREAIVAATGLPCHDVMGLVARYFAGPER